MVDFVEYTDMNVEPATKIVKKDVYSRYMSAEELVNKAVAKAKDIRKLSFESYKRQKQDGFIAGLEEAKPELDKKLIDLSNRAIDNMRGVEAYIVDIVSYCINSIIGDMENEELIAKVAAKKIENLQQIQSFTITVNPIHNKQTIQRYLVNHLSIDTFSLRNDSSLTEDQLIIDTALGSINTTIEREVLLVTDEIKESFLLLDKAI